jgi:hypothetical protein
MIVRVWPCDTVASGSYRTIWPVQALNNAGNDDAILDYTGPTILWDRKWDRSPLDTGAQVVDMDKPEADVIVLQRPQGQYWIEIIKRLQAYGIRVVVDMDDDLMAIEPGNAAYTQFNQPNSLSHYRYTMQACQMADLVTVTTPALASRLGNRHTAVLPNCVPAWYLSIPHVDSDQIGWPGEVGTHPNDLQVTGGVVGRYGGPIRVIGTGVKVCEGLGLCAADRAHRKLDLKPPGRRDENGIWHSIKYECDRIDATGWVPFDHYAENVAKVGIGIVPLADSHFNRAKSALKVCELMALGVPTVASPTPDNLRMAASLDMKLRVANTPQRWHRHLSGLRKSKTLREHISGTNRELMSKYTYGRQAWRWWDAWASVLARKQEKVLG